MIGTLLSNRYEILDKIGEGGMGIVYKAKCTLLNRMVAVKILKSELNNSEDFIARFKREAKSIASLSHPNIVNIYDIGSDKNSNYIVMEFVNGKTLKHIIKENVRLSPLKTLDIALQISKALECAYKNNIVHRDIKPDNILITEDNIAKLTDFGIAKMVDSVTITHDNKILGSVRYLSPEQAKGDFVDWRTDIYSLGVVMYEMITGQVPYNAETSISIVMKHIQEPVIPPNRIINDIPENINQIILKALEKESNKRFQTAKELADILSAVKKNPFFKVNFNNAPLDSTVAIESNKSLSDSDIDSTVIMTQVLNTENSTLKKDKVKLTRKKDINKNVKKVFTLGLIIFSIFTCILMKYLFKEYSSNVESTTEKTKTSESSTTPLEVEKKLVPSVTGSTMDVAETNIINNSFLLGNITYEYSDTVPADVIISQTPVAGTYYEKNGTINLVISQGENNTSDIQKTNGNKNGNKKGNGKEKKNKKK